jgi:hypothetical protein
MTILHTLIRKRLILPYLTGSFHPSFIEEYGDGLLMVFQKPDGVIHHILCGEVWRCCFPSLTVNVTPIRNEVVLFTSSYENFIQTGGIRDDTSHCAKILTCFYDNLDVSDPTDPEVIIKIDVDNVFSSTDRDLTLDVLSGHPSRDYVCGLQTGDVIIPTCDNLSCRGLTSVVR